jgi:hypothetical protein
MTTSALSLCVVPTAQLGILGSVTHEKDLQASSIEHLRPNDGVGWCGVILRLARGCGFDLTFDVTLYGKGSRKSVSKTECAVCVSYDAEGTGAMSRTSGSCCLSLNELTSSTSI